MSRSDRRGERLRLLARGRAREGRAPDVGELAHQRVDQRAEFLSLARLRVPPRLRDEACGQRGVAIDHQAVLLECVAGLREHLADRLVRVHAELLRGARPELRQLARRTRRDHHAELALEPQHVLAHPLAFEPARGEIGDQRADDARQRMDVVGAGRLRQHQRKIVAQSRKIAVSGEQRGAQRANVDRREAVAVALAGHVEDQLVLEFRDHVHGKFALARVVSADYAARLRAASSSGQIVTLSNSASRPARVFSGVRGAPAPRKSS